MRGGAGGGSMQTLNTFFTLQKDSMEWASHFAQTKKFAPVKQAIGHQLAGFQPVPFFYERLLGKLGEAMDLDITRILVWGWRKHREIVQYRDSKDPPGGFNAVPLVEHALVSRHSPTIEPVINGSPTGVQLRFDIVLKLTTKGAVLIIRDGKIVEVRTGNCVGSGSVAYAGLAIFERKTAPLALPGSVAFKNGIPI
jgi:hypothetical protein